MHHPYFSHFISSFISVSRTFPKTHVRINDFRENILPPSLPPSLLARSLRKGLANETLYKYQERKLFQEKGGPSYRCHDSSTGNTQTVSRTKRCAPLPRTTSWLHKTNLKVCDARNTLYLCIVCFLLSGGIIYSKPIRANSACNVKSSWNLHTECVIRIKFQAHAQSQIALLSCNSWKHLRGSRVLSLYSISSGAHERSGEDWLSPSRGAAWTPRHF